MNRVSQGKRQNNGNRRQMAEHAHSEYKHGTMDVRVQEKTFAGFIRMVSIALVIIFCVLVFMALANA
jgi:CHASE3 domain sensor protein